MVRERWWSTCGWCNSSCTSKSSLTESFQGSVIESVWRVGNHIISNQNRAITIIFASKDLIFCNTFGISLKGRNAYRSFPDQGWVNAFNPKLSSSCVWRRTSLLLHFWGRKKVYLCIALTLSDQHEHFLVQTPFCMWNLFSAQKVC